MRRKIKVPGCGIDGKTRRARLEVQRRAPRHIVEPPVVEQHVDRALQLARADAPARTLFPAYLEQVGEIIVEQQRQIEARPAVAMVLQSDPLIRRAAPQENRAHDMQEILW